MFLAGLEPNGFKYDVNLLFFPFMVSSTSNSGNEEIVFRVVLASGFISTKHAYWTTCCFLNVSLLGREEP
jgi:hypothetical protein